MNKVIIGKRVSLGAAITSAAIAIAEFFPDHSTAILSLSVPITFFAQTWVATKYGVTQ
jgi:hypothetical protein